MIYFFYGNDNFRIKQKADEIIQKFSVDDKSGINSEKLSGDELTYEQFLNAISVMPFLAEKRLVLISNLLTQNKDSLLKSKVAEKISELENDNKIVLVFAEDGGPDKREKIFKELNRIQNVLKIDPLQGIALIDWIGEDAKKEGGEISESGARALSVAVGPNLWRLHNEISKLTLFVKSRGRKAVEEDDVRALVESEFNPNVFDFIESIADKNQKQAFTLLEQFIDNGENEQYLLSMIVYQLRVILKVFDLLERGVKPNQIARKAKIHPYVAGKTIGIVKKYSREKLLHVYDMLAKKDLEIKTGEIEPALALDLVVAEFSR